MDKSKSIQKNTILFLLAMFVMGTFLFKYRNVVLACSDSMEDFLYAVICDPKWGYKRTMDFCLARGRASILFPAIVAFRYFVHGSGNYWAIWALQYVPIIVNVWLLTYIMCKHISSEVGLIFPTFFFAFLQVNPWHSLIICYPLDFMFGLNIMIIALYLFYLAMSDKSMLRKIIKYIVSCILFYESIQVYESFILGALIYAWLSWRYYLAHEDKIGKRIRNWVLSLLPHFVVAVAFLGVYVYLKAHPHEASMPVLDPTAVGTLEGFFKTWILFSISMFPLAGMKYLVDDIFVDPINNPINGYQVFFTITCIVAGIIIGKILSGKAEETSDNKSNAKNRALITMAISGLLLAVFFPVFHATTSNYQRWALEGCQYGYVPSTISYYGWAVFLTCIIVFWLGKIPNKNKISVVVICVLGFGIGGLMTSIMNEHFYQIQGVACPYWSYKGQAFHALVANEKFEEDTPEVLYLPSYVGVHFNMRYDYDYMYQFVSSEVILTTNREEFESYISQGYDCAAAYYTNEASMVYFRDVTNPEGDVYLVSMHGCTFEYGEQEKVKAKSFSFDLLPYSIDWREYK